VNPWVYVLSASGRWHRHGPARSSEAQAQMVARTLTRRMGWVCAVGLTAPPTPPSLPGRLPTDTQAACSPVWRDRGLAVIWKAFPQPLQRVPTSNVAVGVTAIPGDHAAVDTPAASPLTSRTDADLSRRLNVLYEANGISALRFACKHHAACSADAPGFVAAQETFVGPEYAEGGLPRLLFLSLDPGSLDPAPRTRTMEAVRRRVLAGNVHAFPQGRHWYQTHCLAFVLLQAFDPQIRLDTVSQYFAHMNSAKCCENNPQGQKGRPVLYRNCRGYIAEEIGILRPDILVTQGKEAREAVELEVHRLKAGTEACEYAILETSPGQRAIHFATHHPRYGGFWSQRGACWPAYAAAAVTFMRRESKDRGAAPGSTTL
jgi:hypothetical protein